MKKLVPLVAALAATVLAAPAGAQAPPVDDPYDEVCPRPTAGPNPFCVNTFFVGEGWTVSGIAKPRPGTLDLYESLLPEWYSMPDKPMVAFSMVRFQVPGNPSGSTEDPGDGYMEGQVALRAKYKDEVGWFLLATPVNDQGQYDSGRLTGMPKYMADLTLRRAGEAWTATSTVQGKPDLVTERIAWSPEAPPATDAATLEALKQWSMLRDPFLTTVRPWDEKSEPKCPSRVKFTSSPFVPAPEAAPGTPYSKHEPPTLGRSVVTVSHRYGPPSLKLWRALVDERQTVAGMYSHASGVVNVGTQRLENCVNDHQQQNDPTIGAADQGPPPAEPASYQPPRDEGSPGAGAGAGGSSAAQPPAQQGGPAATLPAQRPCRRRRALTLRIRRMEGARAVRASVVVNGRRVRRLHGRAIRRPVRLRRLPAGAVTVRVAVRYRDGRLRIAIRRYATC